MTIVDYHQLLVRSIPPYGNAAKEYARSRTFRGAREPINYPCLTYLSTRMVAPRAM